MQRRKTFQLRAHYLEVLILWCRILIASSLTFTYTGRGGVCNFSLPFIIMLWPPPKVTSARWSRMQEWLGGNSVEVRTLYWFDSVAERGNKFLPITHLRGYTKVYYNAFILGWSTAPCRCCACNNSVSDFMKGRKSVLSSLQWTWNTNCLM